MLVFLFELPGLDVFQAQKWEVFQGLFRGFGGAITRFELLGSLQDVQGDAAHESGGKFRRVG